MRFEYRRVDTLPRLAWCAHVARAADTVTVVHGPWVEVHDRFFCEGAWAGPFSAGQFPDAASFFGSGAVSEESSVCFATATHTYERLHLVHLGDRVLISNSLPFLLEQAGDWIDSSYLFYEIDLMSFKKGLTRLVDRVRTAGGNEVQLFYCCNIFVDAELNIHKRPKTWPAAFCSYSEYVDYLRCQVAEVCRNAAAAARRTEFQPLTTLSSGYDSPASALFAHENGCVQALTFSEARPGYEAMDDSGTEIGRLFGMAVTEYSRTGYLECPGFPEAEFLASGTGGEEVVFAALEDKLPSSLLFTGYYGDQAWGRSYSFVGNDFRIRFPAGGSLAEFRLRVGFIHLPLPSIGFVHQPALHTISNSPEMRPWYSGTAYDRPIPRRLLQEAGIPGSLFGQQKMAISQPFYNKNSRLAVLMTEQSYRDFEGFTRESRLFAGRMDAFRFTAMHGLFQLNQRVGWKVERVAQTFGRKLTIEPLISERYKRAPTRNSLAFHWGMSKVRSRYSAAEGSVMQSRRAALTG